MTQTRLYTAEDLWEMGDDAPYVIIDGELIEEVGANALSSQIAARIVGELYFFVKPQRLGAVLGADGTFTFRRNPDTVLCPDAAFIRADRMPPRDQRVVFMPVPPDLAVEVVSLSNRPGENAREAAIYRECGVPLVWYVDPFKQTVIVYGQQADPRTLAIGDTLEGGDVLPGFALPLAELFA
jgi:Uma2 family endonuclease